MAIFPRSEPRSGGGATGRKLRRTHGDEAGEGVNEAHTTGTKEHHHNLRANHRHAGEAAARNDEPQMTAMGHAATATRHGGLAMTASGRGEAGDSITIAAAGGGFNLNQHSSHHLEHQRSTQAPGARGLGSDGGGEGGGIAAASNAPGCHGLHQATAVSQLASVGMGEARMDVDGDGAAKNDDQEEVGQAEAAESDAHAVLGGDLCGETRGDAAQAGSELQQQHPPPPPPAAIQTRRLRGRTQKPTSAAPLSVPEGVVTRGRVKGGLKNEKRVVKAEDQENVEGEGAEVADRPPELKRRRGGRQAREASKAQKKEPSPVGQGEEAEGQSHQVGELKVNRASTPMSRANSNQNNQGVDEQDPQASVVAPVLQAHHSLQPQLSTGGGRPAQSAIIASGAHPVAATGPVSHFQLNQVSIATDVRQGGVGN